jgi:hypothetical protein
MASPARPFRPRPVALAAAASAALLSACVTTPSQQTLKDVRQQANPSDRAQRTITSFTPALRCMDELMFRNGTRDVTLMMEELRDATTKVPVSARDMMTSAISEMTRRSRAVRLSVFGSDQQNIVQLLQQQQKLAAFEALPEFNVRGTISQLDEDVKKDSSAFGLLTEKAFGIRFGSETRFSVIGFDSAVVRTDSLQLVNGVSSKNTTVIVRRDASAGDGQAKILGAGTTFSFSANRSDGAAQATRNMVELAAIELVGKLIRAPYWQCVGTPDDDPEVLRETEDWFVSMDPDERIAFFKERLRERRYYDGAIDGVADAAYATALRDYRVAAGLPAQGDTDLALFRHLVTRSVPFGPFAPLPRARPPRVAAAAAAAAAAATATGVNAATVAGTAGSTGSANGPGTVVAGGTSADPASTAAAATGTVTVTASAAVAAPSTPAAEPATAPAAAPSAEPAAPSPIQLAVQPVSGQRLQLQLTTQVPGYVYCYAQDPQSKTIRRVFPNRYARDPRVTPGRALRIPGTAAFSIDARQELACVHAPREVYADLPPPLRWGDFDPLRLQSFDEIRLQFAEASGQNVALVKAARPTP